MASVAFSFEEIPDSRAITYDPPSVTLKFRAGGEFDELNVQNYAIFATPAIIYTYSGALYRQDVRLDPDGWCSYVVTVPYGSQKNQTGSFTFSFDTSGGSVKIKAAKEHITAYKVSGEDKSNVHLGSIGVTQDWKVEGVDIIVPALKFTITFKHPQGVVTLGFMKTLASATGQTNLNPFLGFDSGELLFAGASGADGSETEAEVAYQFIASQNTTEDNPLTIGPITGIVKQGHHYGWCEFKDNTVTGEPSVQPKRVNIERVYDSIDFESTFGWG